MTSENKVFLCPNTHKDSDNSYCTAGIINAGYALPMSDWRSQKDYLAKTLKFISVQ